MPWHVAKSGRCPASRPWAVIKDSDGSVAGCHPSEAAANKQLAALYANEPGAAMSTTDNTAQLVDIDVIRSGYPIELRHTGTGLGVLTGRFTAFGNWYRVNSLFEGEFMERTVRGSTVDTIRDDRDRMRVLFNHGYDYTVSDKVLGTIDELEEKKDGPHYDVSLFDTSYNRDLLPGLEAGVYGASMRMRVLANSWDEEPAQSDYNPDGLPERTITRIRVLEFGPVTFPANPEATAGIRSGTDEFYGRMAQLDPPQFAEAVRASALQHTAAEIRDLLLDPDFAGWAGARSTPGGEQAGRRRNDAPPPSPSAVLRDRDYRLRGIGRDA
jgi:phage head maturation protease